jgi:spore germination protein (amino acid permease)
LKFKTKITAQQNTSMLILLSFIYQIMLLPILISGIDGPTAWISIVIAMLTALIFIKPIIRLQENHPNKTLLDICADYMPKTLVTIIGVLYISFFILASSILLKDFSEQVKMFMLFRTPSNIIILIILLTSSYATQKGINTVAQIAHITVVIAMIPLVAVTALSTSYSSISNILPIFPLDIKGILKVVPYALIGFFGFIIILFSNPYVEEHKKNLRENKKFLLTSAFIYILCFFLVMFKFGQEEAKRLVWPFLSILKFLNVPGSFIENMEAVGISLSIICAFISLSIILYFTNLSLQKTLGTVDNGYYIYIQTPIIYMAACLLPGMNVIIKYIKIPIYVFLLINAIVLFVLIVIDKRRKKAINEKK